MKEHERLAEPDRHLRRTAMDALEVLRKEVGFQDDDQAEFHVGLMRLVSDDKVGVVDIQFERPAGKQSVVYRFQPQLILLQKWKDKRSSGASKSRG